MIYLSERLLKPSKVKFLLLTIISLMGLLALAACAQTEAAESNPAPAVEAVEQSQAASDETVPQRNLSDLSLVANTGRPQFLDAYATW